MRTAAGSIAAGALTATGISFFLGWNAGFSTTLAGLALALYVVWPE